MAAEAAQRTPARTNGSMKPALSASHAIRGAPAAPPAAQVAFIAATPTAWPLVPGSAASVIMAAAGAHSPATKVLATIEVITSGASAANNGRGGSSRAAKTRQTRVGADRP